MSWKDGADDRAESRKRFVESWQQRGKDIHRSWAIYRRSLLAIVGLFIVLSVVLVSVFADDIAVEHPYRNLQDTEDLWKIDNEPRRAEPFSEECDEHEQMISLTEMRRDNKQLENKGLPPVYSVGAESDDKVGDDNRYYRDVLTVHEILIFVDDYGYPLGNENITINATNSSMLDVNPDLVNDRTQTSVWVTYTFDNSAMHHSWLPDGYDVCIFGTTHTGQDLFSKVLYGSRISLKIGITVALLTVSLGTIIGCVSGYFGGKVDELIMRITDVFFAVPGLILAMAFVAAFQAMSSFTLPTWLSILIPTFIIGFMLRNFLNERLVGDAKVSKHDWAEGNSKIASWFSERRNSMLMILLALFLLTDILGVSWSGLWTEFNGNNGERTMWHLLLPTILIFMIGAITIIDLRIFSQVQSGQMIDRLKGSFEWNNPWRMLSMRTLLLFLSIYLLIVWTENGQSEVTFIEDFDRLWKIQFALIVTGWPGYARLIRGQVLYVKEMTFVEAARSVGASSNRIMFRHVLPNAWAPLLVAFTLDIGGTILGAAGLSFIGLGAAPGTAEWGILVEEGRQFFPRDWWLIVFPGLAIAITTLGFNLLGDGLRDVIDPKNRR
ncbi:MAG: ABC transporter permease [archaeon]|nr:ABC transporter permease [archaeon]MDA0842354.1 ABC transporter permease [archaeon]MDA1167582.1 ABC transporter permease [archaeon]